jgi:hypothetical protein
VVAADQGRQNNELKNEWSHHAPFGGNVILPFWKWVAI